MKPFIQRTQCPVCGSTSFKIYFECAYTEDPILSYLRRYYREVGNMTLEAYDATFGAELYRIASCADCNACFQVSIPGDDMAAELYSGWIASGKDASDAFARSGTGTAAHYMSEAMKLTKLAQRTTGKHSLSALKVLDFGMGRGGFALSLKACFADVWGFEFAEDRDALGQKLGIRMLGFDEIGAGQDFDLINTEQVFEHLPDPRETAERLSAALAPGALLKISVPFNRWLEGGDTRVDWTAGRYVKHSPMPLSPLEHLQYYRRPSLTKLGAELGLQEVAIPAKDHLDYAFGWFGKGAIRNLGRAFFMNRFRNYVIFRKVG